MNLREPFDFLSVFKISTRERYDWINPLAMLGLGTIGVFFIYSAQLATGRGQWMLQIVWLAVGALGYCLVALIDYKLWLKYAHWIYVASLVPLLLLWTPLGVTRLGATRWIDFGPFSLQPSEVAKLGVLIMSASLLTRSEIGTIRESLKVIGIWLLRQACPSC